MIPYKQLSLTDIFTDCQNKFDNDKYEFLSLLNQTIDLDESTEAEHSSGMTQEQDEDGGTGQSG